MMINCVGLELKGKAKGVVEDDIAETLRRRSHPTETEHVPDPLDPTEKPMKSYKELWRKAAELRRRMNDDEDRELMSLTMST